jgi:valyl-tRNA synthetase
LKGFCEAICAIAKVGRLEFKDSFVHRPGTFTRVLKDMHIVIPLSGVIDLKKYVLSLEKKIAKLESEIKAKRHLLKNAGFNAKAPAQVIEAEKAKLKDSLQALEKLKGVLNELRA